LTKEHRAPRVPGLLSPYGYYGASWSWWKCGKLHDSGSVLWPTESCPLATENNGISGPNALADHLWAWRGRCQSACRRNDLFCSWWQFCPPTSLPPCLPNEPPSAVYFDALRLIPLLVPLRVPLLKAGILHLQAIILQSSLIFHRIVEPPR
jgi:hypothetical protein